MQIFRKYLEYFHLHDKAKSSDTCFFIIDPKYKQAGLADRFKAIINTYYIAKANNLTFKLYFKHPFNIERYLLPNIVDWRCTLDDLDFSIFSSKLLTYRAEYPLPTLKNGKQYHYYWYQGTDTIRYFYAKTDFENPDKSWYDEFNKCFNELFRPSDLLKRLIGSSGLVARSYISVHFRFVNLLGNFEGNTKRYPILDKVSQQKLIDDCLNQLHEIKDKNKGLPIYVFSDSIKFLDICVRNGYYRLDGGAIRNIAHDINGEAADKTMLDFFTIGRSKKVYSVVLPTMYGGVFSQYAALIGGAEFERITK